MKYLSEKTNKVYGSVKELEAAEKAFDLKKVEEDKKNSARKERAKEVEEAYKSLLKARKNYNELVDKFIKDYGSYHYSLTSNDISDINTFSDFIDEIFKLF